MLSVIKKWFAGTDRTIERLRPIVAQIGEFEPEFVKLSDEELRAKTSELRSRCEDGESLDDLLPEAFAAVREASRRATGMRHFDVQLIGGAVLHQGKIAEMRTGEGKTLVATLPLYLNSLSGRGVHLVTVNDYLAKRDAAWMGPIYHLLGASVGVIQHESAFLFDPDVISEDERYQFLRPVTRREAYEADITYGTNNEFGFDYLRDNMVWDLGQRVQRGHVFAIVDEVDNILVDEARTPLIISGQGEESTDRHYLFARLVRRLQREEDFTIDEKLKAVLLTEAGIAKMEGWLQVQNLYDPANYDLTHFLEQALKAEHIFHRDRDYVLVKEGQVIESNDFEAEVVIVDEFTGRLMFGRRYSEGLHQALEAKENVKIQRETRTLATITFQNYFRMYVKLGGMTGTALTEAEEFQTIYDLDVVPIPTHRPNQRDDSADLVYKSEAAKFDAVVDEIHECYESGRPVLVGTVSIEKSEHLGRLLTRRGVPHEVLNAKYHEREAKIIAQAGRPGSVTIATNMAGRGVDILLGGNPQGLVEQQLAKRGLTVTTATPEQLDEALAEAQSQCETDKQTVVSQGGLHILGTERHEARRIDNQLRGRAARQGDPGSSRFFISLEDELMRRFGGQNIANLMERFGLEEDVPIEHPWVSKAIENAQTKVEAYNFDIRKHVVQYDDVMNKQREVFYGERDKVLTEENLRPVVERMVLDQVAGIVAVHTQGDHEDEWDLESLATALHAIFPFPEDFEVAELHNLGRDALTEHLQELAVAAYDAKEQQISPELMRQAERMVTLQIMDRLWVEHLTAIDDMREGIGLRAYGQQNPLVEYKHEAHAMFQRLMDKIQEDVVHAMFNVQVMIEMPAPPPVQEMRTNRDEETEPEPRSDGSAQRRAGAKVGRNDPCPCGSGKKYKKCHGSGR